MEEIWKPINEWSGKYWISNLGRFKSIGGKYTIKHPNGYITKGCLEKSTGYRSITLRRPGYFEKNRIHVLVAEHFLIKPEIKNACVNHIDGIKENNNVINLEWITLGENVKHAVKTGLMDLKGEKHPHVKLTEEYVIDMRRMRRAGITHEVIGRIFGVDRRQAGDVINGVNWGWLRYGL